MRTSPVASLLPAALAILLACVILAGMDALGKYLQQSLPVVQVVWGRFVSHFLLFLLLLMFMPQRRQILRPRRPGLQLLRGALLLGVTIFHYLAIRSVSLADSTALLFLSPVLVTVLAGLLLHESIDWRKWVAVGCGFIGVLAIVRPGTSGFQPQILLSLVAAFNLAAYFILTRYLQAHDSETTTIFFTPVVGALGMTLLLPLGWQTPTVAEAAWLLCMGVLGATGHYLLTWAFHRAPASSLSPLLNAQLVAAAIYSAWLFDDRLEPWFYLGGVLIVGAGTLVSRRRSAGPPTRP